MSPQDRAILRLAQITSAHAREVISCEEAGSLYDSIADSLEKVFPEGCALARRSAALIRESLRAQQSLQSKLDDENNRASAGSEEGDE